MSMEAPQVQAVRSYWNSYPLGLQYLTDTSVKLGSPEFYTHIRPWMNPYKFDWIMDRIESEASLLHGKHLLEIGCGMGYDSLEFLKRGVRVTAVDLAPAAVEFARKHFAVEGVRPEEVKVDDALELSFPDGIFDAVWANGVVHHTGDMARAIQEARRVLRPGGRAIISHFYRKPSWMYALHHVGNENIEFKEEDPPVTEFRAEREIEALFDGFEIEATFREHFRALPVCRHGIKAALYRHVFRPVYNMIPRSIAELFAYKYSIVAIKR